MLTRDSRNSLSFLGVSECGAEHKSADKQSRFFRIAGTELSPGDRIKLTQKTDDGAVLYERYGIFRGGLPEKYSIVVASPGGETLQASVNQFTEIKKL